MKQIDISKMSDNERKETVKEAKILEVLSHPNIVKFIEVFKTKNGKLCIVMDFADGTLFAFSLTFVGGDL
jgi:NIMA (never in mitosis gene a)-related kinase